MLHFNRNAFGAIENQILNCTIFSFHLAMILFFGIESICDSYAKYLIWLHFARRQLSSINLYIALDLVSFSSYLVLWYINTILNWQESEHLSITFVAFIEKMVKKNWKVSTKIYKFLCWFCMFCCWPSAPYYDKMRLLEFIRWFVAPF